MFERFTDRARRVVVLAQEEARRLNHNYIGTEHILLGLIAEGDGIGAKALESLGLSLEMVRSRVERIVERGDKRSRRHTPFTDRAKKVLELSLREALQLGHNYIGTEHILLGLVRKGDGVAIQVLVELGADPGRVRQRTVELMSTDRPPDRPVPSRHARSVQPVELETSIRGGIELAPSVWQRMVELVQQNQAMRMTTLEALMACWHRDDERMFEMLRLLVMQAASAEDRVQLATLSQILDIDDAKHGDIHLKRRPDI